MSALTFQFGKELYAVTDPPTTWRQSAVRGKDGQPEETAHCIRCDSNVVWVLPARLSPVAAGQASGYMQPIGLRCECFLKIPNTSWSGELLESPVKITPVQPLEKI